MTLVTVTIDLYQTNPDHLNGNRAATKLGSNKKPFLI
jgi:hypothetical protein